MSWQSIPAWFAAKAVFGSLLDRLFRHEEPRWANRVGIIVLAAYATLIGWAYLNGAGHVAGPTYRGWELDNQ